MTLSDQIKKMCEYNDANNPHGVLMEGAEHENTRLRPLLDLLPEMVDILTDTQDFFDMHNDGDTPIPDLHTAVNTVLDKIQAIA